MLQLLISVLLSLGFSFDDQGKLVGSTSYNQEAVYREVSSKSDYQALGGDDAFDAIIIDNVDPRN